MNPKVRSVLNTLLVSSLLLVACGTPATPAPAVQPTTAPQAPAVTQPTTPATNAPTAAGQTAAPTAPTAASKPAASTGSRVFNGGWPYTVPPKGHYNTYTTGSLALGIYQELMELPLTYYTWADATYHPVLATKWEFSGDNFVITLRDGVKWSDGSIFSAKDILSEFTIRHMQSNSVWRYIDKVTATGSNQVTFHMSKPSSLVQRYVLRADIRPASVYGKFSDKAQALFDAGKQVTDDEVKAARKELEDFRPTDMVVSGPFKIDPASITESQLTLNKVATSYMANQAQFDKIVLFNGETADITPVALSGQLDYGTYGFPPATEKAFIDKGIRILRAPLYTGPALFFNQDVYPLSVPEVRQAMAYAINRDENGTVALGKSGVGVKNVTGFSDNLAPLWMSKDDLAKLDSYAYDTKKAEDTLTKLNFKKGGDGIWVDDKGKPMSYEVIVPSDYVDWSASAENLAEQLTKFGIKVTVRGVVSSQEPLDVAAGKFQLAFQAWGSTNPHPQFSYVADLRTYNGVDQGGQATGPGIKYDLNKVTTKDGTINFNTLIDNSALGLDADKQKTNVAQMAVAFNQQLPILPLWERYGNNPVLQNGPCVTGWPEDSDPLLRNPHAGDPFTDILIYEGRLKGK